MYICEKCKNEVEKVVLINGTDEKQHQVCMDCYNNLLEEENKKQERLKESEERLEKSREVLKLENKCSETNDDTYEKRIEISEISLTIVKVIGIAILFIGILIGIAIGSTIKKPVVSYDNDESYSDYYSSDYDEDYDEDLDDTKENFNYDIMIACWIITAFTCIGILFIYLHLQNQTIMIKQNVDVLKLLKNQDE